MSTILPFPARRRIADILGLDTLAEWNAHAACQGEDTELFFPNGRGPSARAQRICAGCPVIEECREHAERMPERFGIWAGATPQQRGWTTSGHPLRAAGKSSDGTA
ncbi:WhiB family transcriptional regulator [Streptomyces olivoreticuli]